MSIYHRSRDPTRFRITKTTGKAKNIISIQMEEN